MSDELKRRAKAIEEAARHPRDTTLDEEIELLLTQESSPERRASRVIVLPQRTLMLDFVRAHVSASESVFLKRISHAFLIQRFPWKIQGEQALCFYATPESPANRRASPFPQDLAELLGNPVFSILKRDNAPMTSRISVGRTKNCDIVLDYSEISKFHAYFTRLDSRWYITDANSRNGVCYVPARYHTRR